MDTGRLIDVQAVVDINTESSGDITDRGSYIKNGHAEAYFDKRTYVTQRPGLVVEQVASEESVTAVGRGIFYWEKTNSTYIANADAVYRNSYSNKLDDITSGKDRVYFVAFGDNLFLSDPENNEAYVINTSDTVTKITDSDFPSELVHGAVALDGYMFVLDKDGVIAQSEADNAISWPALDFVEAEREPDQGMYIGKHKGNVVVFGSRTIEFLYNAANPTGSVLRRRSDVFYSLGLASYQGTSTINDVTYFVHTDATGNIGVSELRDFKVNNISNTVIDTRLTYEKNVLGSEVIVTAQKVGGKSFVYINVVLAGETRYTSKYGLVFDTEARIWYLWGSDLLNYNGTWPFMQTSGGTATTTKAGQAILTTGDVVRPSYLSATVDTTFTGGLYVDAGYVNDGYVDEGSSFNEAPISLEIVTNPVDTGGSRHFKFMRSVEFLGNFDDQDADDIIIAYSDDYYTNYKTRYITKMDRRMLTRFGRYTRREFKIQYNGRNIIRVEKLEAVVDNGEY